MVESRQGSLPDGWYLDRGVDGRDLVGFLDGWFCRGHGWQGAVGDVLEERGFPYDFAGPATCPEP